LLLLKFCPCVILDFEVSSLEQFKLERMTEEVEIQPELEDESDYSEKELHLLMGN
jgi:hypothetical protein